MGKFCSGCPRGAGKGPDHHVGPRGQVLELGGHEVTQLPGHPMAHHGAPDGTPHDETRARRVRGVRPAGMHHNRA